MRDLASVFKIDQLSVIFLMVRLNYHTVGNGHNLYKFHEVNVI